MLYDPVGWVGGTLYEQPYGGVPFSRGWVIDQERNVVLPLFGHDPALVIGTIRDLLGDPNCARETTVCLTLSDDVNSTLILGKGACGEVSPSGSVDLIRGRLGQLTVDAGSVDLGQVQCLAGSFGWNRLTDTSISPHPACDPRPVVFYLARDSAATDYGYSSQAQPRTVAGGDDCP